MVSAQRSAGVAATPRPLSPVMLAILFAISSYCILSLRAELAPELGAGLFSPRRIVATAGGAVLFWAIVRRLEQAPGALRAGPGRILAMLLIAGAGLLALRVVFGWLIVTQDVSLAQDVRWTIVWVGYLGLSIGLYLAHRLRSATLADDVAARAEAAGVVARRPVDLDDAGWVADIVAAELAIDAPGDRRLLAKRLAKRAGYQVADPIYADANRRSEILARMAERIRHG